METLIQPDPTPMHTLNFNVRNPRRNLPPNVAGKRGESNFVSAFSRVYTQQGQSTGIIAKQFAVAGFGIADLVTATWPHETSQTNIQGNLIITAFEMKLEDWRQALMQAYRYSYFADKVVVVLPPEASKIAEQSREAFERLRIGLWEFDAKENRIREIFTPAVSCHKNIHAKEKASGLIFRKLNFSPLTK
jgi:hypothetical protein